MPNVQPPESHFERPFQTFDTRDQLQFLRVHFHFRVTLSSPKARRSVPERILSNFPLKVGPWELRLRSWGLKVGHVT
jgi:hypothetical protein